MDVSNIESSTKFDMVFDILTKHSNVSSNRNLFYSNFMFSIGKYLNFFRMVTKSQSS
jgi:hypothetical protein